MSWFSRNELADKVSSLEQENAALRSDLEAAQVAENQVPSLTQEIAGLKEDLQSAREAMEAEESAHAATKQGRAEADAKLEPVAIAERITAAVNSEEESDAPIRDAVEIEVTNRIVAAGHVPINTSMAEQEISNQAKLSREAFRAMTPRQQAEHIRNGGKLTD